MSRRSRFRIQPESPPSDPAERARRLFRRGEERRALLLLRQACAESEQDARIWAIYGVECHRAGKLRDAHQALSHAVWLRQRARQPGRANTLREMIARLGLAHAA